MTDKEFLRRSLLCMQRALLDTVLPSLRAVSVVPAYPRLEARFVYEEVDELAVAAMRDAETTVMADFDESVVVEFHAEEVRAELDFDYRPNERFVFRRCEKPDVLL